MWAIFFYWLSLCLLILAPMIALALSRRDMRRKDYHGTFLESINNLCDALLFIPIHVIVSAVAFFRISLLMMISSPHVVILVPGFYVPVV